jgi:hypothetical protein
LLLRKTLLLLLLFFSVDGEHAGLEQVDEVFLSTAGELLGRHKRVRSRPQKGQRLVAVVEAEEEEEEEEESVVVVARARCCAIRAPMSYMRCACTIRRLRSLDSSEKAAV